MKIIAPYAEIVASTQGMEKLIEAAIRVCYKSEELITEGSAEKLIKKILDNKHESTIEHAMISVRIVCDRGVSHELVRHRLASFSQESTRYCNYGKEKFGKELTFIKPFFWPELSPGYLRWATSCRGAELDYLGLLEMGYTPQEARSILPNSLKTELIMSANPREWRHIFKLRTSAAAHPQMAELMVPLLTEFKEYWPSLFGDIEVPEKWDSFIPF